MIDYDSLVEAAKIGDNSAIAHILDKMTEVELLVFLQQIDTLNAVGKSILSIKRKVDLYIPRTDR